MTLKELIEKLQALSPDLDDYQVEMELVNQNQDMSSPDFNDTINIDILFVEYSDENRKVYISG